MALLILARHGRTAANADGILAGWTPGVRLDERGTEQVERLGQRLAATPLAAIVTSPLERCRQTAAAIAAAQTSDAQPGDAQTGRAQTGSALAEYVEDDLGECHYGAWTGGLLADLAKDPLWRQVQDQPSTVHFPPHEQYRAESIAAMRERAVTAITRWDAQIEAEHGPGAVWVAVSHGDVIKSLVSWCLDSPLDRFQRIMIDPASVTIARLTPERPFVLRVNDTGSDPVDLTGLATQLNDAAKGEAAKNESPEPVDAPVGGGAGTD